MIGVLQGTIFTKRKESLVIMVGGVGYEVRAPMSLWQQVSIGDTLTVHVHTHVREDAITLYGFITEGELRLFELIINISGIGPKRAIAIVDKGVSATEKAVASSDVSFFTSIPRLGKKNAQKVIIELKTKLGSSEEFDFGVIGDKKSEELLEALIALGFRKQEVMPLLSNIMKSGTTLEAKVRYALKILGAKKYEK